jgi:hypothetical protein
MNIFSKIFSRKTKPAVSVKDVVTFDELGVKRVMRDGRTESISWDELQEVVIVTTDEGPFVDDVFWVLTGAEKGCAVPSEAEGAQALLSRLQTLPGFRNEAVILAMSSAVNARFPCWRRGDVL